MTLRTTKSFVTFAAPFSLAGIQEMQPAGRYEIETDEEIIEGNGRTGYRRVATLLILRHHGMTQTVTIDPTELEAVLARGQEP